MNAYFISVWCEALVVFHKVSGQVDYHLSYMFICFVLKTDVYIKVIGLIVLCLTADMYVEKPVKANYLS